MGLNMIQWWQNGISWGLDLLVCPFWLKNRARPGMVFAHFQGVHLGVQRHDLHPLTQLESNRRIWGCHGIANWLVVWNMNFIFPYIGNNHPIWLSYFSVGRSTTNQPMFRWFSGKPIHRSQNVFAMNDWVPRGMRASQKAGIGTSSQVGGLHNKPLNWWWFKSHPILLELGMCFHCLKDIWSRLYTPWLSPGLCPALPEAFMPMCL